MREHAIGLAGVFGTLLIGAIVLGVAGGCKQNADIFQERLKLVITYDPPKQDYPPNIPRVRTDNQPPGDKELTYRKSESTREINGQTYGGEKIAIVDPNDIIGEGKLIFNCVARRLDKPERCIDIYVDTAVVFELFFDNFHQGKLVDVDTGKTLEPHYIMKAGRYHLKASK